MEKKLFNYNIISKIGDGGMSSVYLGEDPITGQKVAIKELLPHLAHSEDLRNRFRREAQIMATLDHPNIVKLLRYEETETSFFLIMEFLEGMDLEQHINNVTGPISEPKAIEIMSSLLDAFGYAHEKGIVHRDIKPANIIVTPEGKVKVLDFGIAKIVDDNTVGRTKTGTRIGTVVYMSPEQVRASNEIDLRTDIYSLGVLLHQIVTGKAPYDCTIESDFDIQTSIVRDKLPRAKTIYPYVSDHIQNIIDKATEKNHGNRFQNCEVFKLVILKNTFPPIIEQKELKEIGSKTNNVLVISGIFILYIILAFIIVMTQSPKSAEIAPAVDSTEVAVDTVAMVDTMAVDAVVTDFSSDITETSQERTISFPRVNRRNSVQITIRSLVLKDNYTKIKFRVESNSDSEAYTGQPGENEAFYIIADNGIKYKLTKIDLGNESNKTDLPNGYNVDFTGYFEAIPLNTSTFDLIEGDTNTWGMTGVHCSN